MTAVWPHHPAADLFPMLDAAALTELADDVAAHGLREPVWLFQDPDRGTVLLDGRNRVRACGLAGVPVETQWFAGDDPVGFVVSMNLRRRHLSAGQRAFLAAELLPLYEAQAAARVGGRPRKDDTKPGADRHQVSGAVAELVEPERAPRSADRAATVAGSSGRSVARAKRLTEQAPDLAEQVKAGTITLDRAERIIRDREAEQRRVQQARTEAADGPHRATVDIRHGDFRQTLTDIHNINAIITDPPYAFEYLPLLDDLATWADKVLTPEGVLAVLIGHTYLPEVYRRLDGHRPYRWTLCYLTDGLGYVSHPRHVQSNWKPVIVYGGGPRLGDVIRSTGDDKSHHKWGQNYDAFHTLVERLTTPGQTVADPFMGAGTTLLAALALGRNAVGCDTDPAAVAATRERVS